MSRLAVLTFGIFQNGIENSTLPTFYQRSPSVMAIAQQTPGFIKLTGDKSDRTEPHAKYLSDTDLIGTSELITLWKDLESLFAFVYNGLHAEALNKRSQWFVKGAFPPYVLWWVADDYIPDWLEAYARLEHLHEHGSTAYAFDFKQPFDAEGTAVQVDRVLAKSIGQSLNTH